MKQKLKEVLTVNTVLAAVLVLLYCGPLARAIFRLVFRRGAKQAD